MNKPVRAAALKKVIAQAFVLMLPVLVSGCLNAEMHDRIEGRKPMVEAGVEKATKPAAQTNYNPLVVTDKVWTGGRSVRMRHGLPLPSIYEGPRSVVLVSSKPMELTDIASFVTQQTGVPVRLTDGAENARGGPAGGGSSGGGGAAAPDLAGIPAGIPAGAGPSLTGGESEPSSKSDNGSGMRVAYQGTMSGFLDNIASYFGVSWRYDGTAIIVSRFETRTFTIEAMNGTSSFSDGISGGGSTGGGSSGGSGGNASTVTGSLEQSTSMTGKIDYWAELSDSISTILAGVGTVKAAPSSGTVTVITTPEIMRTVAGYIEQENQRGTRQVAVTVELFTLSLNDSENITTDVNIVYDGLQNGGQQIGFNGQLTPLAPNATAGSTFGVSVVSPTSKWQGTRALIQGLSSLGKVSRVARIPLTTLNNRPTTRRIGRDIAYLAQRSTTTTSGTNSASETLTPGTVAEGFQLQVTPRILGDGRIIVQFSLSVTDLIRIRSFPETSASETQIQLPETASRVFVQQALLKNGDSLVLAGFDQDQQSADNSGFLNPFNLLLGGNASATDTREMIFLTITPREIDAPGRQMISEPL